MSLPDRVHIVSLTTVRSSSPALVYRSDDESVAVLPLLVGAMTLNGYVAISGGCWPSLGEHRWAPAIMVHCLSWAHFPGPLLPPSLNTATLPATMVA